MRYKVTIEFEIETAEYYECGDSPSDVADLVEEMLQRPPTADLPQKLCLSVCKS